MLEKECNFIQIIKESTIYSGKCLDHIYVKNFDFTYNIHRTCYVEHEAVCVILKKLICN